MVLYRTLQITRPWVIYILLLRAQTASISSALLKGYIPDYATFQQSFRPFKTLSNISTLKLGKELEDLSLASQFTNITVGKASSRIWIMQECPGSSHNAGSHGHLETALHLYWSLWWHVVWNRYPIIRCQSYIVPWSKTSRAARFHI